MASRHEGKQQFVDGIDVFTSATLPADTIGNREMDSGRPAAVTKIRHLPLQVQDFELAPADTVASKERLVHIARGTETVREFAVLLASAVTNSDSVSFDLKKNGSSILNSTVDFDNGDADGDVKTGSISDDSLAQGDRLSVEITTSGSPDGKGPLAQVEIDRKA